MTKKEKRKARHDRRVKNRLSRRALLKRAGTAALGLAASLIVPVPIRANVPARIPSYRTNLPAVVEPNALAPTWTKLLEQIGGSDPRLRAWVHDLVLRPRKPQEPLLLTGPNSVDKAIFHRAMSLLLPEGGVRKVTWTKQGIPVIRLDAWLNLIEDCTQDQLDLLSFERPSMECPIGQRYVKWSFTNDGKLIVPRHILHFDLSEPRLHPLRSVSVNRLQQESELFRRSLAKAG